MSEQQAENEFWYLFDNYYSWEIGKTPGLDDAIQRVIRGFSDPRPLGTLSSTVLKKHLESEEGAELRETVRSMLPNYLKMFRDHFGKDFEQEKDVMSSLMWKSFRDFGLGVLYDPRNPRDPRRFMHVMDGGMQLYANWHRFNWIGSMIIPESPFSQPKLYIDRLVGLSAEIYTTSRPCQSNKDGKAPDNPPNGGNITNSKIEELTGIWSELSFDEIENRMSQLVNHISESSGPRANPDCSRRFSGQ